MSRNFIAILTLGLIAVPILSAVSIPSASAQARVYAYPEADQSPEQQRKDQFECHQWASQQTGFDPTNPPPQPRYSSSSPPSSSGSFLGIGEGGMFGEESGMLGDAATGAALGAAGGAIAGDAATGAAIGAIASTLFGGLERSSKQQQEKKWRKQQQAEAQQRAQAQRQKNADYNRAYSACMTSRDYNVK